MALREIALYGQSILRMKAAPILEITDSIRTLFEEMVEIMQEEEGIGLAAPQVGESISLCIINLGLIEEDAVPRAYINPVMVEEEGMCTMEEGCLSIPDVREDVDRPEVIKVRYMSLDGKEHLDECDVLLARVLQHEIDHLNGVLFVDRISSIKRKLLAKKLKQIAAGSSG